MCQAAGTEKCVAKATGVKPVAKSNAGAVSAVSALSQWSTKISAKVASGISKDRAVAIVNRENPGLREQMLSEVNS